MDSLLMVMRNNEIGFNTDLEVLFSIFLMTLSLLSTPGSTVRPEILPVWGSVWTSFVQPVHHTLTLPTGSVQEAARRKAFIGGHDGIQPRCWKVRGN